MKHKKDLIAIIPPRIRSNDLTAYSSLADHAVALNAIEQEIKAVLEKVETLRFAILTQDNSPKDLFTLLANSDNSDSKFLTVRKLSEVLGVDRRTVYGLRSQGLPSHRIGRELRFDPLEVSDWLKKREQR